MSIPDKITLHVKRSKSGLYFVTSPKPRGLLIAAHTFEAALSEVPEALAELESAQPIKAESTQ
jgi:predicted RNase H-like HicB family nuclease